MTKRTSTPNAGAIPLCSACVRQSTSGGYEPLDPDMRWAEPDEACGAVDCVARDDGGLRSMCTCGHVHTPTPSRFGGVDGVRCGHNGCGCLRFPVAEGQKAETPS